jgi:hypothetical protein
MLKILLLLFVLSISSDGWDRIRGFINNGLVKIEILNVLNLFLAVVNDY